MTVHPVGNTSVIIMIGEDEIVNGESLETWDSEVLIGIAREELKKSGVDDHAELDVVAYPGSHGILLFANVKASKPIFSPFARSRI